MASQGEPGVGGGASLLGTPRDVLRKALEVAYVSLYKGSVRGTWREGTYTEDSERHVLGGSGIVAFVCIVAQ